jgi:hypothetical protein
VQDDSDSFSTQWQKLSKSIPEALLAGENIKAPAKVSTHIVVVRVMNFPM